MTKIVDLLQEGKTYSFEFFPPKTPEAEAQLDLALSHLEPLKPSFVSVTYGAGGTTRGKTHDIVLRILRETSMTPMAHLSCVVHTSAELEEIVQQYKTDGVENILALAGDPPADMVESTRDFHYASELVDFVRERGSFSVGVAAQPQGHPRSPSVEEDRKWLANKLQAADFAITQFFFEVDEYTRLRDEISALGVDKPIIPGIMPITNANQIERFAQLSGYAVPQWLTDRVHAVADDPAAVRAVGVEVATDLCQKLLAADAPGLHFYTLNRSTATQEIFANL